MSININIHEHHSCQSASKASFIKLQLQSFIYRAPASKASFTELQLRKLHLQSSDFKASFTKAPASKLHFQSLTYETSLSKLQCMVTKIASKQLPLRPIHGLNLKSPANRLLTKDLGDYTMYHILGFRNWAS
ncbi:hypothetical protein ACFX13_016974 [Malus domestica]